MACDGSGWTSVRKKGIVIRTRCGGCWRCRGDGWPKKQKPKPKEKGR